VAKVLESMACGCKLIAPKQPVELQGYYPYEGAYQCAQQIRTVLADPRIMNYATEFVNNHRMELRFEQIFKKAGVCASSSQGPQALSATT
jgi:hypothetical protein